MKKNRSSKRSRRAPKAILRLPYLDHAETAVLNSLTCPDAQRGYRHAIDEFVDWYRHRADQLMFVASVLLYGRVADNPLDSARGYFFAVAQAKFSSRFGSPLPL